MTLDTAPEAQLSLRVRDLEFSVGDSVRLGPITLEAAPGTTLGVVGETGSGKSLLCRALVGMLSLSGGTIDAGSIEFQGEEFARADSRRWAQLRRRRVGYMPQASMAGLNPVRRVGSQLNDILVGPRTLKLDKARMLMQQVQMSDPDRVLRSYPHELSGGMRQRVMLAFALAGDPDILVADEPTTALDATVQNEVLGLIQQVQKERNMAMVIVSHDMRVIRRVCDRVAVMYGGRIVELGPTSTVLSAPSHPYTRALLQADPTLAARKTVLGAIPGAPRPPVDWRDGGCVYRERCSFATEVCAQSVPELRNVRAGDAAACHHAEKVVAA